MNGLTEKEAIARPAPNPDGSAPCYAIRLKGVPSDTVLEAFPGLEARVEMGETVLWGPLADQSALHGLLGQIEALGLELIELHQVSGEGMDRVRNQPDGMNTDHPRESDATHQPPQEQQ